MIAAALDDDHEGSLFEQAAQLVGEAAAAELATRFAGRRLFVPKSAGENHPLVVAIGAVAAGRLMKGLGGEHLDVPISAGRRAEILALKKLGLGPIEIQRRVKCSRRLVFYVLAQARDKQPSRQLDLF